MNLSGWLALWLAIGIWGGSFLATRQVVAEIPPLSAAFLRFAIASLLLLALAYIQARKWVVPDRADAVRLAGYGFLAVTLCYTFENTALQLTSSGNASVIIGLIPAGTLIAARWFLKERMTGLQWLGTLVATAGTLWLVVAGGALGLSNRWGDLLMVLAMLCAVASGLVGKDLSGRLPPLILVGYGFTYGAIFLLPLAILEWLWHPVSLQLSKVGWFSLIYLAVLASAAAYTAYFYALSRMSLSAATLPAYLIPVLTLMLASWLKGEALDLNRILAALVVVVGLLLTTPISRLKRYSS